MKIRFKKTPMRKSYWSQNLHMEDGKTAEVSKETADHLFKNFPDNFEPINLDLEAMSQPYTEPKKLSQVTLLTIHHDPDETLQENLLSYLPPELEYIQLDNPRNERFSSAAQALNYGMRKAANDLVVFAHEDVILKPEWFDSLIQQETRLKDWGVLGILGQDWDLKKLYWGSDYKTPQPVPLLDECCMVFNRKNKIWFDEKTFNHWHHYGLDYCMQCHNRGLGVYVITGPAFHNCLPEKHGLAYREKTHSYIRALKGKWGKRFPQLDTERESTILKPKKGRVAFIPFRDINTSSTRNRCYENAEALRGLGWDCQVGQKDAQRADFVVFQKRYSPRDLQLAREYQGKTILDLCDPPWLEGQEEQVMAMSETVDCITTSTKKLAKWFRQKGKRAKVMPDSFNFNKIPKVKKEPTPVLCWHGYSGNEHYLEVLAQPLNRLAKEVGFKLKLVMDLPPKKLPQFEFQPQVVEWKLDTYLREIAKCHIGIAPLFLDEWCSYKSPHKLIIYMALGLPTVATANDARRQVIANGRNSFLIEDNKPEDWYQAIKTLIVDRKRREAMIEEGRKVAQTFSLEKVTQKWDRLFDSLQ